MLSTRIPLQSIFRLIKNQCGSYLKPYTSQNVTYRKDSGTTGCFSNQANDYLALFRLHQLATVQQSWRLKPAAFTICTNVLQVQTNANAWVAQARANTYQIFDARN